MKKSGCCPKCGNQNILRIDTQGLWNHNAYHQMIIKGQKIQIEKYICSECGYIESYVVDNDIIKCRESE